MPSPSFQRNARAYTDYLSTLVTRTICPHEPLICTFVRDSTDQALISFRSRTATLGNGCLVRIFQRIGQNREYKDKVTTLQYSYALALGEDVDNQWIVRYDYDPEEGANPTYQYPIAHMHVNATSTHYEEYAARHDNRSFEDIHLPTRRLSVEAFIELLIVQFHAPCSMNKPDAIKFLRESWEIFLNQKMTQQD